MASIIVAHSLERCDQPDEEEPRFQSAGRLSRPAIKFRDLPKQSLPLRKGVVQTLSNIKMRFHLATILAVTPILVSATPTTENPPLTIPLNKRTNVYRSDGSVDIEALKAQVAHSTSYVISPFNPCGRSLTCDIVRSFADSISTSAIPVNATPCPSASRIPSAQSPKIR